MNFTDIDKIYILYINDKELYQIQNYLKLYLIDTSNIIFFKGCIGIEEFGNISKEINRDIIIKRTNFLNKYLPIIDEITKRRNLYIMNKFLKRITKGEMGCSQSHINILKDAIKNNYKKIIVLEYDIFINKDWKNIIHQFNKIDKNEFKCISLGSTQYKLNKPYGISSNLYNFDNYFSTFALFLNNIDDFFSHFISILETFILPADHCLDFIASFYGKKGFAIYYPYLFICDISKSETNGVVFSMRKEAKNRNWRLEDYYITKVYKNEYLMENWKKRKSDVIGKFSLKRNKTDTYFMNILPLF